MANYGSVAGGDAFFANRLHAYDWEQSSNADKLKALVQATELIDQFAYASQKYAVIQLGDRDNYTAAAWATAVQGANTSQPLEFPRGTVNTVPTEIENATYLIAKALLSGRDPELDLETQTNKTARYGQLSTSRDVDAKALEHIAHLIPSPQAWNLIRPFLRHPRGFSLQRGS